MSNIALNAQVWVIDGNNALLFNQTDQMWIESLRMPFADFLGSAAALSSFSLPDTRIYLNVNSGKQTAGHPSELCWAGVAADPIRLVRIQPEVEHHTILQALKTSGKKIEVICTENPRQFSRGTPMKLLDHQELKHLQEFIGNCKPGGATKVQKLQLCGLLWLKPNRHWQRLRFAIMASVVLTATLLLSLHQQRLIQQQQSTLKIAQAALTSQRTQTLPAPFANWTQQIQKFGQGQRANLTAMTMSWNTQGQIHTHVQLERDRKRVPKACQLLSANRAECAAHGESQ